MAPRLAPSIRRARDVRRGPRGAAADFGAGLATRDRLEMDAHPAKGEPKMAREEKPEPQREQIVSTDSLREEVRSKYGQAALTAREGRPATCGLGSAQSAASVCCGGTADHALPDPISSNLYTIAELDGIPPAAALASLGCGNPTALATLAPGETVLDLGSGGGIDVLLSAKRVGATGKAYGLDMTDEMLALARENARKAGVANVEFLKGQIEAIPLPDASVDVIISNCVINLSTDKQRVLAEAYRVLKPGGRLAVSDVVVRGEVPRAVRKNVELWIGCVAGALEEAEYRRLLAGAGFGEISIEPTRIYRIEEARAFLATAGVDDDATLAQADGKFMSAFVRATKPAAGHK